MLLEFGKLDTGTKFIYDGIEYVKTHKAARNAFRVSDDIPKYFSPNIIVEVII
jgi:hypothetical protein